MSNPTGFVAGLAGLTKDVPPFLMVSGHYPSVIRGVNRRGMHRGGFGEDEQDCVMDAYKRLYRQGGALLENAQNLAKEDGIDENVKALTDSVIRSHKHQYGRYLETFRGK